MAGHALEERPQQQYVGARDLTHWPSAAGQLVLRGWRVVVRWAGPRRALVVTLVTGLVLMGALTALAASVYDAVAETDGIAGLDQPALDAAIDVRSATGDRLVGAYTHLGGTPLLPIAATLIAAGLAIWWRQWSPFVLTADTGLGALTMTVIGKVTVGRIRPPVADAVPPFEHSFSFPSGHSLNSMALAGIIAYLLVRWQRHRWARAMTITVALAYAITIGLSRVYLGAHWLTDVLDGVGAGAGLAHRGDHRAPALSDLATTGGQR